MSRRISMPCARQRPWLWSTRAPCVLRECTVRGSRERRGLVVGRRRARRGPVGERGSGLVGARGAGLAGMRRLEALARRQRARERAKLRKDDRERCGGRRRSWRHGRQGALDDDRARRSGGDRRTRRAGVCADAVVRGSAKDLSQIWHLALGMNGILTPSTYRLPPNDVRSVEQGGASML